MASERRYSVMLSSSFQDLRDQRRVAGEALEHAKFFVDRMEPDGARPGIDVIASSLQKVDEAHAYLLLLGRRYGEPPVCLDRNPNGLSATHLEFNRALERGIPIAVIRLADAYLLPAYEESDALRAKRDKLRAAAERTGIFDEVEDFAAFCQAATKAAFALREAVQDDGRGDQSTADTAPDPALRRVAGDPSLPDAPAFREVKPFAQGMSFVGREDELAKITAWAQSNDPLMLIEAMGGMGKSMLTHNWVTAHAEQARPDLAGRLWYSFYEEGADMADFCRQALAYIEGVPVSAFEDISRVNLAERLVRRLRERPWLIVMDGLERVLKAYGRYDRAGLHAELADDPELEEDPEVNEDSDKGMRDPNLCIRPDDDNLLRALASVRPSKLLASSRNMPTALLSEANKPRDGVNYEVLDGLAGPDALRLIDKAGVRGDGATIVGYLERHFGSHPLMIGVVAGLVNDHAPAPGDFDLWLQHPHGARELDLAMLDGLVGKREHVLRVAFDGLAPDARLVLTTLALFSSAVAYDTLEVAVVRLLGGEGDEGATEEALRVARSQLSAIVIELRRRGLVVAGEGTGTYDLHPLVRGFVRDAEKGDARRQAGEAVVDYARSQAPPSLADDATRDDVDRYFSLVEALLLVDKRVEAAELLATDLAPAVWRVGRSRAHFELFATVFEPGLVALTAGIPEWHHVILSNQAGIAADSLKLHKQARNADLLSLHQSIHSLQQNIGGGFNNLLPSLCNLALRETNLRRTATAAQILNLAKLVSAALNTKAAAASSACNLLRLYAPLGRLDWQAYAPDGSLDDPAVFRGENILRARIWVLRLFVLRRSGTLTQDDFQAALAAKAMKDNVSALHILHLERALWLQERGDHAEAKSTFEAAIALGREIDVPDDETEGYYATTLVALDRTDEARAIASRLAQAREPAHLGLAHAWLALGETEKARAAALAAYPKAWADGPPYAFHWDLEECRAILRALDEPEPQLPSTRPEDLPPLEFEADIRRLVAQHEEEKRKRETT